MSFSGFCLNRNLFLGLMGIVLMSAFVSGNEVGVYSKELIFKTQTEEWKCELTRVYSSSPIIFEIESRWSKGQERNLSLYTYSADDIGLELLGKEELEVNGEEQFEYCIKGEMPGTYEGVLLFRPQTGMFGIGIWLKVEIKGEESHSEAVESGETKSISYLAYVLGMEAIILTSMLFLLVFAFKKRKHVRENESLTK